MRDQSSRTERVPNSPPRPVLSTEAAKFNMANRKFWLAHRIDHPAGSAKRRSIQFSALETMLTQFVS